MNALPETFVDHAEEIWRMLEKDDVTQQQVADEIGWTLDKVKKYCALEKISPPVWDVIVPHILKSVTIQKKDVGTKKVTNGTFSLVQTLSS